MAAARARFRLPAAVTGPLAADNEYFLEVTPSELAMLRRIDRDNERAGRFQAAHRTDREFAGIWYDRETNELLVATVTDAPSLRAEALSAGFESAPVFTRGPRSLAELLDLTADVSKYAVESGLDFAVISPSIPENAVVVTAPDPAAVRVALDGVFDGMIVREGAKFSDRACTTRSNCGPPWKGGLQINRSTTTACSSGFVVAGVPNRGRVLTTAGIVAGLARSGGTVPQVTESARCTSRTLQAEERSTSASSTAPLIARLPTTST